MAHNQKKSLLNNLVFQKYGFNYFEQNSHVNGCRFVETYIFCLIYLQSLHLDFEQLMQTSLLMGLKNRFSPMFIISWQRELSMALQGQSLPGTHRVTLCTQVSDEELLIPTDTTQQTNTGSKPPAQPNLTASLLSSPEPNTLSLPHQASIRAFLLLFTGNFH